MSSATDNTLGQHFFQSDYNFTGYTQVLSGVGASPSVTDTIGPSGRAMIILTAFVDPSGSGWGRMGFDVSGATTMAATHARSVGESTSGNNEFGQGSATYVVTGLNPGANTFTLAYSAYGSAVKFGNRSIIVVPLS